MIVLETSSYGEPLEYLKISVPELYCQTENPVNSSNFYPLQESQRTALCLYVHGGGRIGMLLILRRICCLFVTLTYHVTFYVQVLYKSPTTQLNLAGHLRRVMA